MVCIKSVRIRFKPSIPRLLSFLHIFLMLKAMAKKAKSIVTLSFPKWRKRRYAYCTSFVRRRLRAQCTAVLSAWYLPGKCAFPLPFACIRSACVDLYDAFRPVPIQVQRCLFRVTDAIKEATHNVGCTFFRHTLTILHKAIGGRSALRTPTPRSKWMKFMVWHHRGRAFSLGHRLRLDSHQPPLNDSRPQLLFHRKRLEWRNAL